MRWLFSLGVVAACGDTEPTTVPEDTEPAGQCAPRVDYDAQFVGDVRDGASPAVGVEVRVEERNWSPGTVHGSGVTDAAGHFDFAATTMPIIEGCWGWATGFYIVASDGARTDEWPINSMVTGSWQDEETVVDLTAISLDLAE